MGKRAIEIGDASQGDRNKEASGRQLHGASRKRGGMGPRCRHRGSAARRGIPESVSGIQDCAPSAFEKFRDLLNLVGRDSHFLQRLTKML